MSDLFLGVTIGAFASAGLIFYTLWRILMILLGSDMDIAHEMRTMWSRQLQEREEEINKRAS